MKYADLPTVEVDAVIHAPVSRVWTLVTDINLPARFSTEFLGAEWLDPGPALGARFVGRNAHDAFGKWETTSWVNRYEPERAFGWAVVDIDTPSSTWWFTLEAVEGGEGEDGVEAGGAVRLVHGGRMGPAPSGLSVAIASMPDKEERIVARRLQEWERNMRATVEGVKALAEGGG